MAKQEELERAVEGFMFNVLMKMEKKIAECIEKFEPPAVKPTIPAPKLAVKEQPEIDKINAERLARFQADKAERDRKALEEARQGK